MNSLHILDPSTFKDKCVADIFFYPVAFLFLTEILIECSQIINFLTYGC